MTGPARQPDQPEPSASSVQQRPSWTVIKVASGVAAISAPVTGVRGMSLSII